MIPRDLTYRAQGIVLQTVMGLFGALPPRMASRLGGTLLSVISSLFKAQNKRILRHLELAFPDKTLTQHTHIRRGMWEHLGMILGEYAHLGHALDRHPDFRIDVVGAEHLKEARGKPVVFISGHMGNWEILPIVLQQQGIPFNAVYRTPNNPYAARLLEDYRSAHGRLPHGFPKSRAGMKGMAETLKNGGCLGMLIDQRHSGGEKIDFFGHPAEVTTIAVELAQKYGAIIITGRVKRLGPCHFRMEIFEKTPIEGKNPLEITQNLYKEFEKWISDAPEQWLWTHRRWGKKL